jgi:hypothetical protein
MGASISGDVLRDLILTRMLGIPVFLVLLVLVFFFPLLSKYCNWNIAAQPGSKPGAVKQSAPSLIDVALTFFRTWIYVGFAGWILLGAILLACAVLIILQDLFIFLSAHRSITFQIFSNNLLPIVVGWLLIIAGGWSGVYFHKNFDAGIDLIRKKMRLFWYALVAFSGFLLIILKYYIMGTILVFIAIGALRQYISDFVRRRRPNGKADVAGSRIFKDYEEEGTRNSKW